MRLAADIALLERALDVTRRVIVPEEPKLSDPAAALERLLEQLQHRRGSPAEYMLIRDEAVWLAQAAKNVLVYRDDRNEPMAERWTRLAALLRDGIEQDLHNARNSIGALA